MTEEALKQAKMVIDSYAETIYGQLLVSVAAYEREHPGYEFHHLDVKFDEELNQHRFAPIFKKMT